MGTKDERVQALTAIGLMSGASLDGVDVALLETDGEGIGRLGPSGHRAYSEAERALIQRAIADAADLRDRSARPGCLDQAETMITAAHAEAVEAFLTKNGLRASAIAVVGFDGQTVLHAPERLLTVQLGAGRALAARLRIPVVYDLRAADVAAGGQGAPLAAVFHRALVRSLGAPLPIGVINLGGIANLTYVGANDLVAFDTGPGSGLIDDVVRQRTGVTCDRDGKLAASGRVDEGALARLLAHAYFTRRPPKSLDRTAFDAWLKRVGGLAGISVEDAAATLTAFTAKTLGRAAFMLPRPPVSFIVAGGGARNPILMRRIADELAPARIQSADAVGWSAVALEAQALGYLAVRSLRSLPLTFPDTTGVATSTNGGVLVRL
jgi:anhydro-N-acetylmuramic acid kinase